MAFAWVGSVCWAHLKLQIDVNNQEQFVKVEDVSPRLPSNKCSTHHHDKIDGLIDSQTLDVRAFQKGFSGRHGGVKVFHGTYLKDEKWFLMSSRYSETSGTLKKAVLFSSQWTCSIAMVQFRCCSQHQMDKGMSTAFFINSKWSYIVVDGLPVSTM